MSKVCQGVINKRGINGCLMILIPVRIAAIKRGPLCIFLILRGK